VLLEDEISRREAKALAERLRRARFESAATLEEFDFAYNPQVPAPLIRDLAALRFLERGESVLLYGPVGVGKTHVAQALGHLACRRGYTVLFAKTSRLLAELAGGRADGSWEARLRRLAHALLRSSSHRPPRLCGREGARQRRSQMPAACPHRSG